MTRILKRTALGLLLLVLLAAAGLAWYFHARQPQRSGTLELAGLQAPVSVRYDERGVPHIRAGNEADLYRALGYVHAQDRLFQMEVARRLARGELAEILGPKLVDTDRLFRTLGIRAHADAYVERLDKASPAYQTLVAYLDGVNQFQARNPAPIEFDVLGIPKRPFTPQDTMSVAGYLAFSFASAFKTEPVMTQIRDRLGARYLDVFDLDAYPGGVAAPRANAALSDADWQALGRITAQVRQVLDAAVVPPFEGSNAWAIAGSRTSSGKPMLAGDPHIGFSAPAVWYEAHLESPGFDLYGHFQVLNPMALLGHNSRFGWSMTMFQNDDVDMAIEKPNPDNPDQVWHQGGWVDLQRRTETIAVKGAEPVTLTLRRSPRGPIINDAYPDNYGTTPVAMWWAFLETENPILEAFHELNRADTLAKARQAAGKIHAPGLNVVWANADGDIAWWAAARLPMRPQGVNPTYLLDAASGEADKPGFHPFANNPQEENPARGYVVSANHQPAVASGIDIPGYYQPPDRVQRLVTLLQEAPGKADVALSQAMQLDVRNAYAQRVLAPLLPVLRGVVTDPDERQLLDQLAAWDGSYTTDRLEPTLFVQLLYEIAHAAMHDELGPVQFENLRGSRSLDFALPRLVADATSPWWDSVRTPTVVETREQGLQGAWRASIDHLRATLGADRAGWTWGKAHTVTHNHPLGQQKPLDKLFSVGPFPVPGGRELPNALGTSIGPAPWAVTYGPSTRRIVDFGDASQALGINPVGQSGVLFDRHYRDQAATYVQGGYVRQWLSEADVAAHTRSTLTLAPATRGSP
ncbi:MAG: penicillin acylase family protein [Burkholderiaceae bacterium]